MYTGMNNNGYFTQGGFPIQNGLTFNNVTPPKQTSSTPEELEIIRGCGGTNFDFTEKDAAIASWDLREGTQLAIELVDPKTDRVRIKYTNEEFNIVLVDDMVVKAALDLIRNIVFTTKLLNTSLDKNISKEIYKDWGAIEKLLPTMYSNGKKNYNSVIAQAQQQIGLTGYQNVYGQNMMMFNGQYGSIPNYFVNDGSVAPNIVPNQMMGYNGYPQQGGNIDYNRLAQAMLAQQQGMGVPTQPNGGIILNGNPFVQNGAPQQTPQMTQPATPPFPGAPQQGGVPYQPAPNGAPFNPPIGAPVQTPQNPGGQPATTSSAPF